MLLQNHRPEQAGQPHLPSCGSHRHGISGMLSAVLHIIFYDCLVKHVAELVDPAAVLFDRVDVHIADLLAPGMLLGVFDCQFLRVLFAVLCNKVQVTRSEIVGLDQGFVVLDLQIVCDLNECSIINAGLLN